ncbi:hypothetical protein EDD11_001202 [Mortierella claussenii]|nr:hypothetical protein EDD11_001202 [Mortierella claussenii]
MSALDDLSRTNFPYTSLRKIKCDVDKNHPCKNCERSAIQCTLVGPTMRPPRNISGSTSAAAAAAVAVAVATAAAANAHGGSSSSFQGVSVDNISAREQGVAWPASVTDQGTEGAGGARMPGLLVRRASASGQLMRVDDDMALSPEAAEKPKKRRSLVNSSSSPTSLRALFNAGVAAAQSSESTSSELVLQTVASHSVNLIESASSSHSAGIQGVHTDLALSTGAGAGFDYFDHPLAFSEPSSSSSTPSGAMAANGITQFGYPADTVSNSSQLLSPLSSPLCLEPSSLPPTPLHAVSERATESIMAGLPVVSATRYASGNTQFQSPVPFSRHGAPRRASSSSYLPSNHSDTDSKIQHHDRRTSAPWASYNPSVSQPAPYDGRHPSQTQVGSSNSQSHQYSAVNPLKKSYATTDDIQPYPTQSSLMRSNSTPAALRSPLKSLARSRNSALPSRRSHISTTRQSLNLYASTDKVIQDLSLPQQLYRNSALPQRNNSNMSHLQFQLHLQQLQQSQQRQQQRQRQQQPQQQHQSQRSQSLPRFHPEQNHRSSVRQQSQPNMLQWQGYGTPQPTSQGQQVQQEPELTFDMNLSNQHTELAGSEGLSNAHSGTDGLSGIGSADILSPVGIHNPSQLNADLQAFVGQLNSTPNPIVVDDMVITDAGVVGTAPQELLSHHQNHQVLPPEELPPKLQFDAGYIWKQDENADRLVHGHTRHQSASHVYPQQPPHFQPTSQQRANLTRSLQDLTHYTATMVEQQQRATDHVHYLSQDPPIVHSPTDQSMVHDSFGASLALVLDDNLRLLDDMDVVPELSEYEVMSQQTLVPPSTHGSKGIMLHSTGISPQPDQTLVGSSAVAVMGHLPQRSIFSTLANPGSNDPSTLLLTGAGIDSNAMGSGAELFHFQDDPYVDTLSFLDLSGTFFTPSASSAAAALSASSAATSSSLPNTSFLENQGDRLYQGFSSDFPQQPPIPSNLHNPLLQLSLGHHHHHHHQQQQQQQLQQQQQQQQRQVATQQQQQQQQQRQVATQQPLQQHIIHQHHHHHHHHHIH